MRVLMPIRKGSYENKGGDLMQMEKTKEYLERLGIVVTITTDNNFNATDFDIIHLSNLVLAEDTYPKCRRAVSFNKPIVLSTIYWNKDNYLLANPNFKVKLVEKLGGKSLAKLMMKNRWLYSSSWQKQKKILKMVDLIITTSKQELIILEKDFRIKIKRYKIIPVGVDTELLTIADKNYFIKKYGFNNYILCVGRIEDLKNQLSLIKIWNGRQEDLLFIGDKNSQQVEYYNLCKKEAEKIKNIHFLPFMPQTELFSAYVNAKIHVQPSWFESFGLTTVEAAVAGTNVITTINCPLREYFGDLIDYCDPANSSTISKLIDSVLLKEPNKELPKLIIKEFNWGKIASRILETYKELL